MVTKPPLYFDWAAFLAERGIEHRAREGRGWAELACPFCGDADRGRHLGVRLDPREPGWNCWKDADHRGRHPEKLVQALLGCSRTEAVGIVENASRDAGEEAAPPATAPPTRELRFTDDIHPLSAPSRFSPRFAHYLQARGFVDWTAVACRYDLRWALAGPFGWRLIIPVYDADGRLVTWTGRSIKSNVEPKYRTLSHRLMPAQPQAVLNIKEVIYNSGPLRGGGRRLVVTEGPMDAIKVDHYGSPRGVRATCLFGKAASSAQLAALAAAAPAFTSVVVLLDSDARADAWALVEALRPLCQVPVSASGLPAGTKDPGELTKKQVEELSQ